MSPYAIAHLMCNTKRRLDWTLHPNPLVRELYARSKSIVYHGKEMSDQFGLRYLSMSTDDRQAFARVLDANGFEVPHGPGSRTFVCSMLCATLRFVNKLCMRSLWPGGQHEMLWLHQRTGIPCDDDRRCWSVGLLRLGHRDGPPDGFAVWDVRYQDACAWFVMDPPGVEGPRTPQELSDRVAYIEQHLVLSSHPGAGDVEEGELRQPVRFPQFELRSESQLNDAHQGLLGVLYSELLVNDTQLETAPDDDEEQREHPFELDRPFVFGLSVFSGSVVMGPSLGPGLSMPLATPPLSLVTAYVPRSCWLSVDAPRQRTTCFRECPRRYQHFVGTPQPPPPALYFPLLPAPRPDVPFHASASATLDPSVAWPLRKRRARGKRGGKKQRIKRQRASAAVADAAMAQHQHDPVPVRHAQKGI